MIVIVRGDGIEIKLGVGAGRGVARQNRCAGAMNTAWGGEQELALQTPWLEARRYPWRAVLYIVHGQALGIGWEALTTIASVLVIKDGLLVGTYAPLYVVDKVNGQWGIRRRSSFAG